MTAAGTAARVSVGRIRWPDELLDGRVLADVVHAAGREQVECDGEEDDQQHPQVERRHRDAGDGDRHQRVVEQPAAAEGGEHPDPDADMMATTKATEASRNESPNFRITSGVTARFSRYRLPEVALHRVDHPVARTGRGSAGPARDRARAWRSISSVPRGPEHRLAGSPGARCIIEKTTSDNPNMIGIDQTIR